MHESMEQDQEKLKKGMSYALSLLSRRERSTEEIRQKLINQGIDADTADCVIENLKKKNYLSDERFASIFIRHLANKVKGPRLIQQKLKEKGLRLDCADIDAISKEVCDTSQVEAARAFVLRKYPGFSEDKKIAHRASQALMRRGFLFDTIKEALQKPEQD